MTIVRRRRYSIIQIGVFQYLPWRLSGSYHLTLWRAHCLCKKESYKNFELLERYFANVFQNFRPGAIGYDPYGYALRCVYVVCLIAERSCLIATLPIFTLGFMEAERHWRWGSSRYLVYVLSSICGRSGQAWDHMYLSLTLSWYLFRDDYAMEYNFTVRSGLS